MYRSLAAVEIAIDTYNGTFLTESDTNKPLIVQKSLRNTIMMIYGLSRGNNNKYYIRTVGVLYRYMDIPTIFKLIF